MAAIIGFDPFFGLVDGKLFTCEKAAAAALETTLINNNRKHSRTKNVYFLKHDTFLFVKHNNAQYTVHVMS